MSLAVADKSANLLLFGSALPFTPLGLYPLYCLTKAAVHNLCITARKELASPAAVQKNLRIIEVVPPCIDRGLDAAHRESTVQMQGGSDKAVQPMPLDEYLQKAFAGLEKRDGEGKLPNDVSVDFGEINVNRLCESFGKML